MLASLWVKVSGDPKADAAYVLSLPALPERRRELARLELIYGAGYRWDVERYVKEGWNGGFPSGPEGQGGREDALALVQGKREGGGVNASVAERGRARVA